MHTAAIFLDVEYRETSREVKQNSWVAKTNRLGHARRQKQNWKQESHNMIAYSFQSSQVGKVNHIWDFWLNGQKQRLEGDCFALNHVQRSCLNSKQCQCRSEDRTGAEASLVIQKSWSFKAEQAITLFIRREKSLSTCPEACALCLQFTGRCLAYNEWICAGLWLRQIFISACLIYLGMYSIADPLNREFVLRFVRCWTKGLHTPSFNYFSLCILSLSFPPLSSSPLFLHFSQSLKCHFITAKAFANIWPKWWSENSSIREVLHEQECLQSQKATPSGLQLGLLRPLLSALSVSLSLQSSFSLTDLLGKGQDF